VHAQRQLLECLCDVQDLRALGHGFRTERQEVLNAFPLGCGRVTPHLEPEDVRIQADQPSGHHRGENVDEGLRFLTHAVLRLVIKRTTIDACIQVDSHQRPTSSLLIPAERLEAPTSSLPQRRCLSTGYQRRT
jgi:hypothetical protein